MNSDNENRDESEDSSLSNVINDLQNVNVLDPSKQSKKKSRKMRMKLKKQENNLFIMNTNIPNLPISNSPTKIKNSTDKSIEEQKLKIESNNLTIENVMKISQENHQAIVIRSILT